VIPALQKINVVFADQIDQPMLLRYPPRPDVCGEVLGLADASKRIAENGLNWSEQRRRRG
jgi:hypothetical protein